MATDIAIAIRADDRTRGALLNVQRQLGGIQAASGKLRGALTALSPALLAAFSFAGISAFAAQANRGLLAIKDLSEATGSSIENISGLENVVRRAGGQLSDAAGVLVRFNDALRNADRTKTVGAAIRALGLDAAELKRIDPAEALRQVAVALERFEDNGNKARLTQELFGRGVKDAVPILKELAEQTQLTGTVTAQAVEEADKFDKNLARLRTNAEDLARSLSGPLVSALNDLIEKSQSSGLAGFFDSLNNSALGQRLGVDDVSRYRREVEALESKLASLRENQAGARSDNRAQYQPQIDAAEAQLRALRASFYRTSDVMGGRGTIIPPIARPDVGEVASGGRTSGGAAAGAAARFAEEQRQLALLNLRAVGGDEFEAETQRLQRLADALAAIPQEIQPVMSAQEEMVQGFLRSEKAAYDLGAAIEDAGDKAADAKDFARDLGLTFSSAFEDAIVNGAGLSDVLKALEKDILRIVTRRLVTEPLGNFIAGLFGGGRASGGPVSAGTTYLVGERGPELFRPGASGSIVPNHAMGGVSISMQPIIRIDARTDQAQVAQLVAAGMQQARQSMFAELKARGIA